jgi:hypothetical protein
MTQPLPLPIRVLVKGSSQEVWTSWMGGPRTDYAWPRVVEAELHAAGRPAEVRSTAYPAALTRSALKTWDEEVIAWSPDVVIVHLGLVETIHLLLPPWFRDHVYNYKTRTGPVRNRYRVVLQQVWRILARVQQAVDGRVNPNLFSRRPRRVVRDLEHLITQVRNIGSPLVLLPDFLAPGAVYDKWFPGMGARVEAMNAATDELIAKLDSPDVRRFSVRDVVAGMDLDDEPTPDGIHYIPAVHREVGRGIAQVVLEWADGQPYLKLPS